MRAVADRHRCTPGLRDALAVAEGRRPHLGVVADDDRAAEVRPALDQGAALTTAFPLTVAPLFTQARPSIRVFPLTVLLP